MGKQLSALRWYAVSIHMQQAATFSVLCCSVKRKRQWRHAEASLQIQPKIDVPLHIAISCLNLQQQTVRLGHSKTVHHNVLWTGSAIVQQHTVLVSSTTHRGITFARCFTVNDETVAVSPHQRTTRYPKKRVQLDPNKSDNTGRTETDRQQPTFEHHRSAEHSTAQCSAAPAERCSTARPGQCSTARTVQCRAQHSAVRHNTHTVLRGTAHAVQCSSAHTQC
uniref:Uncharacterized protein n=1 Tax=Eutreptiella gymnastica TaxID=73025 RepID=A0A7S4FUR0_9EUGL